MLIEELMVDFEDSASSHDFNDFEDLGGGSDLGLGEEAESLLDYLHARCEREARSFFQSMPVIPLRVELMLHDCLIYSWAAG